MPRRFRDAVSAALVMLALFAILMVIAPPLRDRTMQFAGGSRAQWLVPGQIVSGAMVAAGTTARGYAADHSYMVFFLIVAGFLFILMLRT